MCSAVTRCNRILHRRIKPRTESDGWQTVVIRERVSGKTLGMASYMRVRPEAGSAEVGCIVFSKSLQRTAAATEAMFMMARHLFDDLGWADVGFHRAVRRQERDVEKKWFRGVSPLDEANRFFAVYIR